MFVIPTALYVIPTEVEESLVLGDTASDLEAEPRATRDPSTSSG